MIKNKQNDLNISLSEIIKMIEVHRYNAYRKINEELVALYYEIGKYLSQKLSNENWGSKTVELISNQIKSNYPNIRGFDKANIYRMIKFYETYRDNVIVSTLSQQISWSNNVVIFSHKSSIEEKEFYIKLCIKYNYSVRELKRQIMSHYYERYLLSDKIVIDNCNNNLPIQNILDHYSLEFLDLPINFSEKDLRKAIVSNLKLFILEIGNDFTFVGEEYRIQVGNRDFFIDLLFYNRTYSCLVAFELKIDEFQPEYISKMNFYLEALDRNFKKPNENPSVGIILCTSKDEIVVQYTLARSVSPTAVADYSTKIIDGQMLKNRIKEIRNLLEKK